MCVCVCNMFKNKSIKIIQIKSYQKKFYIQNRSKKKVSNAYAEKK